MNKTRKRSIKRLQNIFNENGLFQNTVCAKFAHTAADSKSYSAQLYNLDAITVQNSEDFHEQEK